VHPAVGRAPPVLRPSHLRAESLGRHWPAAAASQPGAAAIAASGAERVVRACISPATPTIATPAMPSAASEVRLAGESRANSCCGFIVTLPSIAAAATNVAHRVWFHSTKTTAAISDWGYRNFSRNSERVDNAVVLVRAA